MLYNANLSILADSIIRHPSSRLLYSLVLFLFISSNLTVQADSVEGSGQEDSDVESLLSVKLLTTPTSVIQSDDELLTNGLTETCSTKHFLSSAQRDFILNFHNQKRSSLALGKEPNKEGFMQTGRNIYQLSWDYELEKLAQEHVATCSSQFITPEKLASTSQLMKTFWLYWDGTNSTAHLEKSLNQWWNQGCTSGNEDSRNRYFNKRNYFAWANMAKGKTTRIGCSYKQCSDKEKAVLTCLYSEKAQCELEMIYEPGQPCKIDEDCFTFTNSKCIPSTGLCLAPSYVKDEETNFMCPENKQMTDAARKLALEQHNFYRSRLARGLEFNGETNCSQAKASRMLKMEYDCELERYALAHAEKCVFAHNNNWERPNQGQNLYMTSAKFFDSRVLLRTGIEKWWQELEEFGIPSHNRLTGDLWRTKGKLVGHWTQMAWDRSFRLGCVTVQCPHMGYVVCHYGPAGNRRNQLIYAMGEPCKIDSDCGPGQTCLPNEGLCAYNS